MTNKRFQGRSRCQISNPERARQMGGAHDCKNFGSACLRADYGYIGLGFSRYEP
jgi:hypothetical protein